MKGKYANAAEKRRGQEALEYRVVAAERDRDRLAAELTDARHRHELALRDQRARIASLEKERDQAVAPALEDARSAVIALKAEVADLRGIVAQKERSNMRLHRALTVLGTEAGLREADAFTAANECFDEPTVMVNKRLLAVMASRQGSDPGKRSVIWYIYRAIADGRYRVEGSSLIFDKLGAEPAAPEGQDEG